VLKHYQPYRFIAHSNTSYGIHKSKPPELRFYSRRMRAIPLIMALAAAAVPEGSVAQNSTPPTTSSSVSADGAFRSGVETFKRKDFTQAATLFRRAADQGDARAQAMLGSMYRSGWGVKQDYAQALLWNQKAADAGISDAQFNLGVMYANGEGVTRDIGKATEWVKKAAAQGDMDAQQALEALQHAAAGPSDDEIINAVKDRLRREALDIIEADYAGVDKMTADATSIFQAKSEAAVKATLTCSLNAPRDRPACLARIKAELLAERAERIKTVQNSDLGTQFVYSVQEKTNYEGNYGALVTIRARGTATGSRWKILLQFANGAWAIIEKNSSAIR
jgi:hypothetical protein